MNSPRAFPSAGGSPIPPDMGDSRAETIAPREPTSWRRGLSGPEDSVLLAIGALLLALLYREITGAETLFKIGSFDLGASDPAFVLICLAALRCWLDKPLNVNAATVPALILAALVCVSFVRGIERNPFASLIWLRASGFLAPVVVVAATLRPRAETFAAIRAAIVATGIVLALLVLLRVTIDTSLFFTVSVGDAHDINDGGRAIANRGAVILAMAMLLTMAAVLRPTRTDPAPQVALLGLLATGLVLSGQATAIIAAGAGLLALIVLERPFRDRSVIGVAATLTIALLYLTSARWIEMLPQSARGIIRHRVDNLGTRQAVWDSFSAKYVTRTITDRLIGLPAGSDPALVVFLSGHWRPWLYSLHSMYIGLMSSVGLAGLCAYIATLLACLAISAFLARADGRIGAFTPALSIAFLLVAAIQSYSYDVRQETLILLLLPLLLVAQARRDLPGERRRPARRAQDEPASA